MTENGTESPAETTPPEADALAAMVLHQVPADDVIAALVRVALPEAWLANATFTARIRSLLPVAWREGSTVVVTPAGFAVGVQDTSGGSHVLHVHRPESGFLALLSGRTLRVSYQASAASEGALARYRTIAETLLADETYLTDNFTFATEGPPPAATDPSFDLAALPAAPETLRTWVIERLPEDWREHAFVVLSLGGFSVGVRKEAELHVLRVQGPEAQFLPVLDGRRLVVSYLATDPAPDAATLKDYRAVAQALLTDEDGLTEALPLVVPPTPAEPAALVVPPTPAEPAALMAWLDAQPPADAQTAAMVRARLPAEWGANARVVLVRNSFALVLHDAVGIQHVLRAELLAPADASAVAWSADHGFVAPMESLLPEASRPEEIVAEFHPLAHGPFLGFSYLSVSASPDADTLARYRAVAQGLLAIEQHLVTTLGAPRPPLPQQSEFDLSAYPPIDEDIAAMVRTRLPAEWRTDARVVQVHGSFALGLRDASGIQHVLRAEWLDAGLRQRARGNHLEASHIMLPREAALSDRYSNLTANFLAAEDTLSQALLTPTPGARWNTSQTRAPLSDDPLTTWVRELLAPVNAGKATWSADESFVAQVKGMLPEESRAEAVVVLAAGGFAVGFRDPSGNRHMIRVLRPEGIEAEFHPLAHGRSLGFSYLPFSASPTGSATLTRYGAIAKALLAIEQHLLTTLHPTLPQQPEFDLSAYPPIDEDIAAMVRTRLPAEWRTDARVVQVHDSFALGLRDASGIQHVLRAEWLDAGLRQRFRGNHLEVSHIMLPKEAAPHDRYSNLTADFLAAEAALSQALLTSALAAEAAQTRTTLSDDSLTTWVRELLAPGNADEATWSADESFVTRVKGMLPEESRAKAVVVLAANGFAIGFHDPSDNRHMIRTLRPERVEAEFHPLAHGRTLGFSYLSVSASPNTDTLARYRAVAMGLLAIEQRLATSLRPPPSQQPEFDLSAYPPIDEDIAAMIRTRLPAEWRTGARVVQVHGSFALGLRDASGIQHVLRAEWLDAGLRQRSRGNHLEASHIMLPKEAALLDRYSDLTADFLAAEDALSQALLTPTPGAGWNASQTRAPLSDDPLTTWVRELLAPVNAGKATWSADESFVAQVKGMLPEESRAEAVVVLAAGGFAVGFHDPSDNRHIIRVLRPEGVEAEFYPLAHGRSLGFSYLPTSASPTNAVTRYRAIVKGLLAIEQHLLTTLHPPLPQQPEFDLSAYPPIDEGVAALVRARLPAEWRAEAQVVQVPTEWRADTRVMPVHDSFALGLRDASGIQHVLRAEWLDAGLRQRFRGDHLEVSHIMLPKEAAPHDRYSNLAADFLAAEAALSQTLFTSALAAEAAQTRTTLSDDPLTAWVREMLAPGNADEATTWSADESFVARVKGMLPEESRAKVLVLLAANGFAVGFHDPSGNRHMIRALRPERVETEFHPLAHGHSLGFSYLSVSARPPNAVTLALYAKVAETILADEDDLITAWYPPEIAEDTKPKNFVEQLSGRLSGVTLRSVDPATGQARDCDISVDHSTQRMTWTIRAFLLDAPLGLIQMSLPEVLTAFAGPIPPGTTISLQGDDLSGQPRTATFRVAPSPANTATIGICVRGHADPLTSALIPYADMDRLGGLLFDPNDKSSTRKHR